jgi:hypothetical protein
LATIEDMGKELERRKIGFALVASHVLGFDSGAVEAPQYEIYVDRFSRKHPAYAAAFLCDGIQHCLNKSIDVGSDETIGVAACTKRRHRYGRGHTFLSGLRVHLAADPDA